MAAGDDRRQDERTEAVRKGALDITRARTELGYEPRYPIKNGLAAYIEATRAGRG
jgi:nucleoside-diphosphate-sugar epimerase